MKRLTLAAVFCLCAVMLACDDQAAKPFEWKIDTPAPAPAPPPPARDFSFKGNTLEMTLEQFRANPSNVAPIPVDTILSGTEQTEQRFTPLCSDHATWDGEPKAMPGELICFTGTPTANVQSLVVDRRQADHVWYRFYGGRLHEIDIAWFDASDFDGLSLAFETKLGVGDSSHNTYYQNGFGAHWAGKQEIWTSGTQGIILSQGAGMGPGQDSARRTLTIEFMDAAIQQQIVNDALARMKPPF